MKRVLAGVVLGISIAGPVWAEPVPAAAGSAETALAGATVPASMVWEEAQQCASPAVAVPDPTLLERYRQALDEHPEDAVANLCLGVAASRRGDKGEAERLLKQALRLAPERAAVHYALADHYERNKIYAEAGDYYDSVLLLDPAGGLAPAARIGLKRAEARLQARSWQLQVNAGLQYDSNVILLGQDQPEPTGYSGQSDWSGVVSLHADYTPYRQGRVAVTAGYNLYQSLHASLHDYDVTQNLVTLAGSYEPRSDLRLKLEGGYEYLLLSGAGYDQAWQVAPAIVWQNGRWGFTVLDYRLRATSYRDSALLPNNSQRDGVNHHLGVAHQWPVTTAVTLVASYAHDEEATEVAYWDFRNDRAALVGRIRLPYEVAVDLAGDFSRRRYDGIDPGYGATRNDSQYTLAVTAAWPLTDELSLSLGEVYIRNRSNIGAFDYARALTSCFLVARF